MNVMHMLKGEPRWKTIDKDTMNMILGKAGKLPGELAPEIKAIVKEKGLEYYTGNPQDAYPDELPKFIQMMKEEGWDRGEDDEELFEFAMHERQYRDYKSGAAKERFNKELEAAKAKANAPIVVERKVVEMPSFPIDEVVKKYPNATPVQVDVKGSLLWQIDVIDDSKEPVIGQKVEEGKLLCVLQTVFGLHDIMAPKTGKIVYVASKQGEKVQKNQIIAFIE